MNLSVTVEVFFGAFWSSFCATFFPKNLRETEVQVYKDLQVDKVYYCRQCQSLIRFAVFEKTPICPKCGQKRFH
jgi:Zn finger protein HypA/HybF involved in hydrogenase expression